MVINLKELQTPLGPMYAGASLQGVCFLEFGAGEKSELLLEKLCNEIKGTIEPGENHHLSQLEVELNEYFAKKRTQFTIPLHLPGTDFQKSVWHLLREIPFGKTMTYKQQAVKFGNLSAIRAVAAANGQNKHAIIIPCHRVLGSNGNLTGYAGGIDKKKWLLEFEMEMVNHVLKLDFG